MAIAPTGAIYKTFTFDSQSSSTYGVYITGAAVYNAPERDVEMIEIPGRNGAFAFDKGRFQNIEVTYPAGIFADNETNWAEAISNLRNMLCSRKGYCRLTDDYNPNEYRMAVYKSGLEVDPAQLRAGEFNITFECQPQRFLKSGETKQTIAQSGDTLTNPTLFDARPMLEISGSGDLAINGQTLSILGGSIGKTKIYDSLTVQALSASLEFDDTFLNVGDRICYPAVAYISANLEVDSGTVDSTNVMAPGTAGRVSMWSLDSTRLEIQGVVAQSTPTYYGTAQSLSTSYSFTVGTSDYGNITVAGSLSFTYDGAKTITVSLTGAFTSPHLYVSNQSANIPVNYGYSTQSTLGNPLYFDLDIGEAYKIQNGVAVSVNSGVTIPAELPKLAPGSNTITFDNTITQLKIVPRWWRV